MNPDKLARANAIKDAIRAASTETEVNEAVRIHAAEVLAMADDEEMRPLGIQIKNLAAYQRREIRAKGDAA